MKHILINILYGLKHAIERAIDRIGFVPDTSRFTRRPEFKLGTRYIDSAGRRWKYGQRTEKGFRFK